jgi:hypothetical protein
MAVALKLLIEREQFAEATRLVAEGLLEDYPSKYLACKLLQKQMFY